MSPVKLNIYTILILLSPLVGTIFGAFIAYHNDISAAAFSFNIIAVALGIPLALLLSTMQAPLKRHLIILSLLVMGLITSSLLSLDIAGVHRWVAIGSIYVNISVVLSPLILYAISVTLESYRIFSLILAVSVSIIHILQPDAGQATAFGCAAIVIFLFTRGVPFKIRLIGFFLIAVGIGLAWHQPDTLPAIQQVERILYLAVKLGNIGVAGVVLSIIFLLSPIFFTLRYKKIKNDNGILVIAFIVYLVAAFCVTNLGNYPVPIIGAGASPIFGYYAILGLTIVPYLLKLPNATKNKF